MNKINNLFHFTTFYIWDYAVFKKKTVEDNERYSMETLEPGWRS